MKFLSSRIVAAWVALACVVVIGAARSSANTQFGPLTLSLSKDGRTAQGVGAEPRATARRSTGSGQAKPATSATPARIERVWPDPPALARIRFITTLTPQTSRRRSMLKKLWDAVSGGGEAPVMAQPYGIAIEAGRVYVADAAAHAVHVFESRDSNYSRIDIEGKSIIGVAALGGRLFVTDSVGDRVICMNAAGKRQWTIDARDGLLRPTGIVAAGDRLHVVDTLAHRIVTIGTDGRVIGHFGSRGAEPGQFNYPTSIARDSTGRLYVVDAMNFRVQVFTPAGRFVGAFGQAGDGSGDFSRPRGIALDSDDHVYVVDALHDVVQIFDRRGRLLLGFGEPGHREGEFWLASGIAIANDRIYVADSSNRRIQVFEYLKEER